jgi:aminoglycoside phosphotransferase (APT) family kinase protein
VAVRKIGKTAAFLSGPDGRRYVMRIARSPIASSRAKHNFEALEWLQGSVLPDSLRARVPAVVVQGRHAGYAYFVETCMDGRPGPPQATEPVGGGWPMEAVDFITGLHAATMQRTTMSAEVLARFFGEPVARLSRACGAHDEEQVIRLVASACEASLVGRVMPLVRTHGDFTESNCLFDAHGQLTAVVDWEVSAAQGLPLIDLLQLMPIPGETGSHPRWQRFDAWLELWRDPERVASDQVMARYVRTLEIQPEAIPGLILAQWLTHVGDRIEARRDDERWVRLRLNQPLDSLGRILRG